MKNKHDGCVRGFHHYRAAWYGKVGNLGRDVVDEINIGMYHPEGGTTGEFSVKWEELSGEVVARLNVYNDGWNALAHFGDALARMAALDGPTIAPEVFCELLVSCGVVDLTDRKTPVSVETARVDTSRAEAAALDLLAALQMISAGHACPSALAADTLDRLGLNP